MPSIATKHLGPTDTRIKAPMTRAEYIASPTEESHREYYAQLVDARVLRLVQRRWSDDFLAEHFRRDTSFNSITLSHWDELVRHLPSSVPQKMRSLGDYLTMAGGVCVLKEAARQIAERFLSSGMYIKAGDEP